jgi:hypothetical protein
MVALGVVLARWTGWSWDTVLDGASPLPKALHKYTDTRNLIEYSVWLSRGTFNEDTAVLSQTLRKLAEV